MSKLFKISYKKSSPNHTTHILHMKGDRTIIEYQLHEVTAWNSDNSVCEHQLLMHGRLKWDGDFSMSPGGGAVHADGVFGLSEYLHTVSWTYNELLELMLKDEQ